MTILSDRSLHAMYPESEHIQPASIDCHLGDTLTVWPDYVCRDPRYDQSALWKPVPLTDGIWVIEPGRRYLCTTAETVTVRDDLAGEITGRSSWGRDGLEIHRTAGWLDPGFHGRPTLELSVVGSALVIWPGARACQIVFHQLDYPCVRPYAGKYQFDCMPTPSRMHQEVRP